MRLSHSQPPPPEGCDLARPGTQGPGIRAPYPSRFCVSWEAELDTGSIDHCHTQMVADGPPGEGPLDVAAVVDDCGQMILSSIYFSSSRVGAFCRTSTTPRKIAARPRGAMYQTNLASERKSTGASVLGRGSKATSTNASPVESTTKTFNITDKSFLSASSCSFIIASTDV